ncbi:hypothetical protein [Bacillus sp. MSP13]|uniref:hypothetical protein n=1 Tax=Bacillus sp. MSP13 TaxID=1071061 RepID=UPI000AF73A6B|nr:hypothetical protein [Bacillus sp. MSP13]
MMEKIHDSKILNYQIDFESSIIQILSESDNGELFKIVFEDFFAFHFEDQIPNSILLDIFEEEINSFVLENEELLEKGKSYYWPMDYDSIEELMNHIKENSYQYFKIQASYGLNGWILSKKVLIKE